MMELTEESAPGVVIVAVSGRIDTESVQTFGDRMAALIEAGSPNLLIEFSRLTYIGSSGLHALLVAARLASGKGGRVVLCGLAAPVRQVVELAALDKLFEIHGTREEALTGLAKGAAPVFWGAEKR